MFLEDTAIVTSAGAKDVLGVRRKRNLKRVVNKNKPLEEFIVVVYSE
jgi:hypothetical protein